MITEDYVSFETAKLLREKGFKGSSIITEYDNDAASAYIKELEEKHLPYSSDDPKLKEFYYPKPTIQMAMKWLRQKYNLHIITLPYAPMCRRPYHPGEADMVYIAQLFRGIIPIDEIGRSVIKLTPEEACDAAIKYCLEKLI